ncbi:MAG: adenosylmethionine--8-amino-7-oxononanoate transaminase [Planctomycetota bacterium]
MSLCNDDLAFDRDHLWHPYAIAGAGGCHAVENAQGCRLRLHDGRELIDGMGSWWCAIHGYRVPALDQAAHRQLERMAHVMFGGLTHEPAIRLGQELVAMTAEPLQHVFLADSGSVSIEVAIKMALQFHMAAGRTERTRLLTIRRGYHGDTSGAMSVCDPEAGMHHLFSGLLPQQRFIPAPECRPQDAWDESQITPLAQSLEDHDDIAAVILEPIVQGAGGMCFYHPTYLQRARELCDRHGVLLICDEIATGFGRTGSLFAYEQAGICPDILCLGKALTGGYGTLAAVLATERVAHGVSAGGLPLLHGPTFMGNPLMCAIANASIDLLLQSPWQERVHRIEGELEDGLAACRQLPGVRDVRCLGAIGVVELEQPLDQQALQNGVMARGAWVRPFGRLVYVMPAYVMTSGEVAILTTAIRETLRDLVQVS